MSLELMEIKRCRTCGAEMVSFPVRGEDDWRLCCSECWAEVYVEDGKLVWEDM